MENSVYWRDVNNPASKCSTRVSPRPAICFSSSFNCRSCWYCRFPLFSIKNRRYGYARKHNSLFGDNGWIWRVPHMVWLVRTYTIVDEHLCKRQPNRVCCFGNVVCKYNIRCCSFCDNRL